MQSHLSGTLKIYAAVIILKGPVNSMAVSRYKGRFKIKIKINIWPAKLYYCPDIKTILKLLP